MSDMKEAIKAAMEKHNLNSNQSVLADNPAETKVDPPKEETPPAEAAVTDETAPKDPPAKTEQETDLEDVKLTKQVINEKKRLIQKQMEFSKERDAYKAEKEAWEKEREAFLAEKKKYEDNPFQYAVDKGRDPKELIQKFKDPSLELTNKDEDDKEYLTLEEAEKLAEAKANEALTKAEQAKIQAAQREEIVNNQVLPELTSGAYPRLEEAANKASKEEFLEELDKGAQWVIQEKLRRGEIDEDDLKNNAKDLLPIIIKETLKSYEKLLEAQEAKKKENKGWLKPKENKPAVEDPKDDKGHSAGRGLNASGGTTIPENQDRELTQEELIKAAIRKHVK